MENGAFAPKEQSSIFHRIFKYMIHVFQRRQKVLLWRDWLKDMQTIFILKFFYYTE